MITPFGFFTGQTQHNVTRFGLLAAVMFAGAPLVQAAVSVSNLLSPHASPGYEFVEDRLVLGVREGQDLANSFTTGGAPLNLVSISVAFAGGYGSGFTAYLYDNAGGAPGTMLLTLNGQVDPHGGGLFDYSPTGSYTALANTIYWAVLVADHTAPDRQFPVYSVADSNQIGDPGWSIGDNFSSRKVTNGVADIWIGSKSDTPLQFAVNTSAVPEVSTSFALLSGMILLGSRRRR